MIKRPAGLLILTAAAAFAFPNPEGTCAITTGAVLPQAVYGAPITYTFATTGCATPLRSFVTVTGQLPPGLELKTTTSGATLSGTPAGTGTYAFALRAFDANNRFPSKSFVIRVNNPLQIDTPAAATGLTGAAYTDTIRARGGVAPYTFTIVEGALPAGLTLAPATGVISGTMPAAGTQFRVRVTDSSSVARTAERPYTIVPSGQITTTTTPPVATPGVPYSYDIDGSLGASGFSLAIGMLPAGLSIDTNGLISGNPSELGEHHFTIRQTVGSTSVWRSYRIFASATIPINGAPRDAEETFAYDHVFAANGIGPFTYSVSAGALPAGITLDPASGALTGELPLGTAGSSFSITTVDAAGISSTQPFSITRAFQLQGAAVSPPVARVNQSVTGAAMYSLTQGGSGKAFSRIGGVGDNLIFVDSSAGTVTYAMPTPGVFTPTVLGTDALGGAVRLNTASITIVGALAINTTVELPNGRTGASYSASVPVLNGNFTPLNFTIIDGTLPTGLSLNATTGAITGLVDPMAIGAFPITVRVTDAASQLSERVFYLGFSAPLNITTTSVPGGTIGTPYNVTLTQNGATGPAWSVPPSSLPFGLSLSGAGVISGTPTVSGSYTFDVLLSHAATGDTDTKRFTINVADALSATISPASTLETHVQTSTSAVVTPSGGRAPFTLSVTGGVLPEGFFFQNLSPVGISGVAATVGSSSFTIVVTDADGRVANVPYSVVVRTQARFTSANPLTTATLNVAYNHTLTAEGGLAPYVFSLSAGTLPTGITLSPAGVLSGTPTVNGTYNFTLFLNDSSGSGDERSFSIEVTDALVITNGVPLPNGLLLSPYSTPITTTGGAASKTFSISAGDLPPLITIDPNTGVIGNLPLLAGVYNFTVRAEDSAGRVGVKAEQLSIGGAISIAPTTVPNASLNTPYSQQLTAPGAVGGVGWSIIAGALPAGLTLNPSTGLISGTPTVGGSSSFTVQAVDSTSATATRAYTMQVLVPLTVTPASLPNGTVGTVYSQTLTATGASGAVTWAVIAGTLPAGLTLGASSGVIGGTPTAPGTSSFTIQATDSLTQTGLRDYAITVLNVLGISPATVPNGAVGTAYSQTLTATGATGAVTWAVASGTLPAGLALGASSGVISGTPTAPGTSSFTVHATDSLTQTGSRAYSLTVVNVLGISPATVPNGTVGTAYSQTLTATGASGAVTWAVASGTLPAGLALGASSGVLSGTPTAPGTSSFTVQATDSLAQTGSRAYSLTVLNVLGISPATVPNGTVGTAYSQTLTATGSSGAVTWAVASGTLPTGLTLGASTGVIGGTPTASGTFAFTVQATDSSTQTGTRSYSITVSSVLNIAPATVPNGTVGVAYNQTLTVTNGTGAVSWLITAGALPAGLSLGTGTGVISGTPTAAGTFSFTVQATDSLAQTGTRAYTPTIAGVLTIAPATVPNGTAGTTYSQTLTATGGTGAVSWAINAGTLPPGLTLGATTGAISGSPSAAGSYSFTVLATDSIGQTGARAYTMTVAEVLTIAPATLPDGSVGVAYNQTLTATPATGQVVWDTSSGTLPTGLTLGPTTGTITGTPTAVGTFTFTVVGTDSMGQTGSRAYSVTIGGALTIAPATIPNGMVGVPYSQTLTANSIGGGPITGGATWSISSGALPAGLTLGASNGQIAGTPSVVGTFAFTVVATTSNQNGSRAYTMDISAGLAIAPSTLPDGEVGTPYSQALTVAGAFSPFTFSLTNGTLPAGLTLSSGGLISGTPTTPGSAVFTVLAQNTQGQNAQRTYTMAVPIPQAIAPSTLPDGLVGVSYGQTFTVTGTSQPFTWTISSGTLPPGLALTAATGVLSGTPVTAGTFSFLVLATDAQGRMTRASFTMSVLDPFLITTASLPDGTEPESYAATLTSNSAAPSGVTWSIATGTLPPGLTLAPATGVISGTTAVHGTYSFTVQAANSRRQQATRALSILVVESLVIVTQNLGEAVQGRPYTGVLTAAGGRAPYVWSLVGSALPAGLSLNPATGVISGTTSLAAGGYPQNVVVTDSRGRVVRKTLPLTLSIPPPPSLSISPSSLPNGRVGQAYSASFSASGGTPGYSFNLALGAVPTGLTFSGGSLSGTPTAEGTFRFTVNATDAAGSVAGNSYVVVIEPAPVPLVVTPASIAPTAPLGQPLSLQFGATGGKGPYTFTFAGNTPPGMNFNSSGLLSGTPSQGGSFSFTVEATDSLQAKASRSYSITISGNLMITTLPPLAEGIVGKSYAITFGAAGGRAPFTWSLSGTAPAGLAFDGATGTLAGTPTAAGTYPFSLTVQDSQRLTATASFSITVYDPLEITNGPADTPLAPGTAFSFTFTTRGGKAPVSLAISGGGLPAGLSMNSAGAISGTPTTAGTFPFAVQATDALGNTATRSATLRVLAGLIVTTSSLPSGTVGVAYTASVGATGGVAPLGSWSISAGALPAGLSLAADGTIGGTPSAAGTASFTVRIVDAAGTEATRALSIVIALPSVPPLVISGLPQTLPPGTQTNITISLAQPFPVTVTGTLTLIFEPNAVNNADDPSVQFSSGGRTVTFTIPAGETSGTFPVAPLRLVSGTVAGTIRIQTTTNPASATPVPDSTVPIARSVPVITAGTSQLGTGTLTLLIDGFSNTREISSATFRLTPTAGAPLQTTDIPVAVAPAFTTWYQSSTAALFGGQFRMTMPFTVTGSLGDIESVTVTVSNAVGASQPFTVRLR